MSAEPGRLYVIAAPSGAGKTSLVKALMEREPRLRFSVSYTTRKPRANEIDGRDYHFISPRPISGDDRARRIPGARAGVRQFLRDRGAARSADALAAGGLVLLEIDWQGARQVRERLPDARTIFILPPTRPTLERAPQGAQHRFRGGHRSADFKMPRRDIAHWTEFDFVVINDRFDQAVEDLHAIVRERGDPLVAARPDVERLAAELLAT